MTAPPLPSSNSTPGDGDPRQEILLSVGPVLFGSLLNWLLLGILTMQVYVYYLSFPRDYWWIKLSAYGFYLLELGQTALVTDVAWDYLCAGWGIPSALWRVDWGFSMTPLVSGLIACWAQTFFAWRVWAIGHNTFWKSVAVTIFLVALTQGCAAIILGVKLSSVVYIPQSRSVVLSESQGLFFFYLSGSAIADSLIAASMLYFLITTRRATSWSKETDKRIIKLIRTTFETGILCSALALLDLAVCLRFSHNYVHIAIVMALSKLYSNSLMVSLNSRAAIYERPTTSDSREESYTISGRAQFTSIGIPVTTGEFEWVNGSDGHGVETAQEYVKTGRAHKSIALTNLGRV